MSELPGPMFEGIPNAVRKKRSARSRRPETHSSITNGDNLSRCGPINYVRTEDRLHNAKLVQDGSHGALFEDKGSQNGMISHGSYQNFPGISNSKEPTNGFMLNSTKSDDLRVHYGAQPINGHSGTNVGGIEHKTKVKMVKFKVDGVTNTIRSSATSNENLNGYFARDHPYLVDLHADQKDIAEDGRTYPLNKGSGLQGIPSKDFPRGDFSAGRSDSSMGKSGQSNASKKVEKSEPVRKSKRAPNRRELDLALEDDEVDGEIRFLKKLRNIKSSTEPYEDEDEEESSRKRQKYSRVSDISMVADKRYEMMENVENKDDDATTPADRTRNSTLTARQRALQSGRVGPSSPDANLEFPNGLQPASSKRKKDNLSEKELLKKAEAAQKRRLQNELAAQKSQEDAIRKILSQDSSKKKKEDQRKKRMEELAEEKAAEAIKNQSNTIRVVMAPSGVTVLFGENCIPSMFTTKPPSYPPPRERCSGPSCGNPYKYRDSKSNLPLCSLKCYKAVRERLDTESSC